MTTTEMKPATDNFYVTGGTLRRDAACYVERHADQSLYEGLMQGNICYVLTSRQMGKSSLMVRTAARLREAQTHVVVLDLTAIGQNLSAEQWYDGLLGKVGQQLDLEDELEEFWAKHTRLSQLQRWINALREVVLPQRAGRIIIFVDEIDAVRSLPFPTDEFFAAIRELYNRRTEDPELERLTFCLLGVATPSDLIRDTRTTPFNIGQRIELNDFTDAEAEPLAHGLGRDERTAQKLLKRILYWTGGHPYLTQRLCQAIAEDANVHDAGGVDRLCEELFFTTRARERDDNLLFVRERLLKSEADRAALLDLYKKLRENKRVKDDETNPLISVLRLSGITRVVEGLLYVRNRIYYRVFDREWVLANLPDAEVQRQRAAYRRGLWRATAIAAVILAVVSGLAFLAFWQRNQAKQQAEANRRLLYAAQMNLAGQDWEAGNSERIGEMLNAHLPVAGQEDLRGFEWFYLWRLNNKDIVTLEMATINSMQLSNDRKTLVAIEAGSGSIALWDTATWKKLHTLQGPKSGFASFSFSLDDRRLYSLGIDRKVQTWEVATGQEIRVWEIDSENFRGLVCMPDGKRLALAGMDGKVSFREAETGKELVTFQAHSVGPPRLHFTPDDKYLVTASFDGAVKAWDVNTLKVIRSFEKVKSRQANAVGFSPDGKTLVIEGFGASFNLYEVGSFRERLTLGDPERPVDTGLLAFSPQGDKLAIASGDRAVHVYEVKTGQKLAVFNTRSYITRFLAFLADGKTLVLRGDESTLEVRKLRSEAEPEPDVITGHESSVVEVVWAPDGKSFAAAADFTRTITIRDSATGKEIATLKDPTPLEPKTDPLLTMAFSSDGQRIVAVNEQNAVTVWDVGQKKLLHSFKTKGDWTGLGPSFSPDAAKVAIPSGDQEIMVFDVNSGSKVLAIKLDERLGRSAFSPDGKILAVTTSSSGNIKFFDLATGKEISTLKGHPRTWSISYSPDGERLAIGTWAGQLGLWNIKTGRQLFTTRGHGQGIISLSFTPDGKRFATGGFDKKVKLWDGYTGQELLTLAGHTDALQDVAFSPDGKTLLSAGGDKTIRLWRAATAAEVQARRGQ